jgi:hypothetical protein
MFLPPGIVPPVAQFMSPRLKSPPKNILAFLQELANSEVDQCPTIKKQIEKESNRISYHPETNVLPNLNQEQTWTQYKKTGSNLNRPFISN